mmetsp:Transcript_10783/g.14938  ORF Transcript_10783/g.14938 Transcript_10783/m.14938 type:complete len:409 (+) Transcript_10783:44-1270(+)
MSEAQTAPEASPPVATVVTAQPAPVQAVAVTIPDNVKVGQVISVQGPVGETSVAVPHGVKTGEVIQILMPAAPLATPLSGLDGLASFLGSSTKLEINQKVQWLEALSLGCCEQQNVFDVRLDNKEGAHVLTAKEKSACADRICCKPKHSFLLHVTPAYDVNNVLVTLERRGCECTKLCFSPKPCLGVFSCSDLCTEEVIVHKGKIEGTPGSIEGGGNPVAVLRQPQQCCKPDCFTPTLHIYPNIGPDAIPVASVKGPFIFGGCSELCCKSTFNYQSAGGNESADIVHLIPRDCGEFCKFLCTDSDNYSLTYDKSASPDTKAHAILSSLILDTMFFEIDQGLCSYDVENKACVITCCLCFCAGCLCPCNITIPLSNNGGGGAPSTAESAIGAPPAADNVITNEPTGDSD